MYRRQVDRKRQQRLDAERKTGIYRSREADKRAAASQALEAARRASNASSAASRQRDAQRHDAAANAAAKEAARWQVKAAAYGKEEGSLAVKLTQIQQREGEELERRRRREQQAVDRRAAADRAMLLDRVRSAESLAASAAETLRPPKPEKLRVLMLAASSEGDLRVGREQKRIRAAVQSALHRDLVELDVRPSATANDLLDGITGFRPHIVHFSGHSDDDLIVLEDELDAHHPGVVVSAQAFAHAIAATDTPPLLVVLNSCNSAGQAPLLVGHVAPFVVGMPSTIEDGDAITYATAFYAAVANGQSILSAHHSGRAALEMAGLTEPDLPTLGHAADADPAEAVLVIPLT